jgi:alkanesulfonate monooxygenase SsuD/methylene tetrahydromethanopterin reductase-like flavin-dependent oxidoreductase (luciferase family)
MPVIARGTKSYGVVLPHFGPHASAELLLRSARRIEELGFDAVWVRDHLVYEPRPYDDPDVTHIEPFVVLSALASVTRKLVLGTATLIPHRHPIYTALLLGSLLQFTGPGRVIAGWGIGGHDIDFNSIGMGGLDRKKVVPEQIDVIRQLWGGEKLDFAGEFYRFDRVAIRPIPDTVAGIPIWIGGASKAAARRAVEFCDGWIVSRIPRRDIQERIARMQRLSGQARRDRPIVAVIPYMSPGRTIEEAVRSFNMPELCAAMKQFIPPPGGAFRSYDDLDGAAIAGPADVIAENVNAFHELGVEHFVFDFRTRFANFEECVETVGTEVLPLLRSGG